MEKSEVAVATEVYPKPDKLVGVRHIQVLLCFLLLAIGYGMRVNLSVGINAMTDPTASPNPDVPTYNWTNKSIVLSSFFWGYVMLQVIAGQFAKNYGPKWFLVMAMLMNSLGCLLTPLMAAKFGSGGVMGCRIVQGLFQGFFFPSVHALLGKWAPPPERSRFGTFVFSGSSFGTIISMPITGIMSASWIGWPSSFYLFGILGVMWTVMWGCLGANSPTEHDSITQQEKDYITHSFGPTSSKGKEPTPWKSIFSSMPFWAIIVASFGQNWGYSTLLTEIPSYLSGVMHFNMTDNGILSAAPYLALLLLSFIFGPISDMIINREIASRGTVRKVANTIGTCVPAAALVFLGFVGQDQVVLCVTLLIVAVGVNAAVFCGFQVNHIDLSPNHAGTLMGIGNGSSNIFSIIAPMIVQVVVGNDTGNQEKWRTIFLIASSVYVACDIFYVMFASGEIQPWDYTGKDKNPEITVVIEESKKPKSYNAVENNKTKT